MMTINEVSFGSSDYLETCNLRDRVMRQPLGLSIKNDDLSYEEQALITVVKEFDKVIGTGILTLEEAHAFIRYICVDDTLQKSGVGKLILNDLEERARLSGKNKVVLEARVSAKDFYKKYGYVEQGEEYLMDVAPIPHIFMEKNL